MYDCEFAQLHRYHQALVTLKDQHGMPGSTVLSLFPKVLEIAFILIQYNIVLEDPDLSRELIIVHCDCRS